jgi:DNA-directed RNA polymerase specialized sigma24 family protein
VYGHEYADIAARMGVSVSMIEKHMMAATAALREADD